jgi:ribonuclease-3
VQGLDQLGLPPEPGSLYELAVTHRSYAYEQPVVLPHNERLEFLGDAVLGVIVSDLVYRTYPDASEGTMARLRASVVNTHALAALARAMELGPHILLGRGEEASGGRGKPSVLADTFEAVVGAAYLDRGMEAVSAVLVPIFAELLADALEVGAGYDAKTALQEATVRSYGDRPVYRVAASGPDHDKRFEAHAYVNEELYGVGAGRSKKEAEQSAARQALERLAPEAARLVDVDPAVAEEREQDARAS